MIRTLIVDDSPLARSIIRDFLENEGSFEIVGEAEDGRDSVDKARNYNPDLITMDYDMPVMNGLDAIVEIRKFSQCGIVVISTHDTAKLAYEAAVNGAHEFYAKDNFTANIGDSKRSEIFNTLKHIANIKKKFPLQQDASGQNSVIQKKIKCVVIASSTGGPMALCQLFSVLPATFPVPILIVQHNTSGFDKGFVQWLDGYSQLNIQIAEEGIYPSRGNVYVSPTEKHLIIGPAGIAFDDSGPVNSQKPAADYLFKSASEQFGSSLVSVVLTGMGNDGAEGTRAVKNSGGITIAQDEATSMIYGMPEAAFQTGCVDFVLPLSEIALKLISLTGGEI